ncbi:hypothetical protein [Glycomyces paridis]|uniref:hypothetical protein n=1 Tax=Glycomyces paridis TaxID=2126555 RepID=UPI0018653C78|nr:hypothetical protein [Glycomyces paridis]
MRSSVDPTRYIVRFGANPGDFKLLSGITLMGLLSLAFAVTDWFDGDRHPPLLLNVIGILGAVFFLGGAVFRIATFFARPVALRADGSGLTLRPMGPASRAATVPWRSVSGLEIASDTSAARGRWLVIRASAEAPARRVAFSEEVAARLVPGARPGSDLLLPIDGLRRFDLDALAAVIHVIAPHVEVLGEHR